jgi:hypothetical protein
MIENIHNYGLRYFWVKLINIYKFYKAYILSIKDVCVVRSEIYCTSHTFMWITQSLVWSDNFLLAYASTVVHVFGPRWIHDHIFLR